MMSIISFSQKKKQKHLLRKFFSITCNFVCEWKLHESDAEIALVPFTLNLLSRCGTIVDFGCSLVRSRFHYTGPGLLLAFLLLAQKSTNKNRLLGEKFFFFSSYVISHREKSRGKNFHVVITDLRKQFLSRYQRVSLESDDFITKHRKYSANERRKFDKQWKKIFDFSFAVFSHQLLRVNWAAFRLWVELGRVSFSHQMTFFLCLIWSCTRGALCCCCLEYIVDKLWVDTKDIFGWS